MMLLDDVGGLIKKYHSDRRFGTVYMIKEKCHDKENGVRTYGDAIVMIR
jgi:hypothetical protein